jgi:hypothetical protein
MSQILEMIEDQVQQQLIDTHKLEDHDDSNRWRLYLHYLMLQE